jgi:hypothetical protein
MLNDKIKKNMIKKWLESTRANLPNSQPEL